MQLIDTIAERAPWRETDVALGLESSILPLRVSGLCYRAGAERLLDGISFSLHPGPCTVVLGPNGAGKSLLLRLCHGLITPSAGIISWGGLSLQQVRHRLAMVFQHPVMLRRSAAANVDYALSLRGISRRMRQARVANALQRAGLTSLAKRSARLLSGGEQQRLAIARAWALQPQVLLLDEPSSNLDPTATRAVEELIQAIVRSGTKVIMSTHDLAQARRLGEEVLFLHRGCLLEHAPADSFFTRPDSPEAAAFIDGRLLF
jgi:ABC-type phosphate transport system, ATPase component